MTAFTDPFMIEFRGGAIATVMDPIALLHRGGEDRSNVLVLRWHFER
eukprot:SAG31_NODE_351_length_17237_cov_7.010445_2_plen_47_part_00